MTHRIEAVYEKGVFRPVDAVALAEGARVRLALVALAARNLGC